MKQLTDKQKKAAWIIALVLVVMHFANPLILSIRQRLSTPAAPVFHKPSPATVGKLLSLNDAGVGQW